MIKYKLLLQLSWPLAVFLVWHHYDPIGADVLGILLGVLVVFFVGFAFKIYFMPIKSKQKNIAKYKAKHGIPWDRPHKVDAILKEGFFRLD
jgi:hypothetical protein